jgi:hypothetical protein
MRHRRYQDRQPRPHDACRPSADRLRAGPPAEPRWGAPCRGPPPVRRVDTAPDAGRARRFGPAYPFGTGTRAHRSRRGTPAEPARPAGRVHCGWLLPGEGGQHAPAMTVSTPETPVKTDFRRDIPFPYIDRAAKILAAISTFNACQYLWPGTTM